MIEYLKLLMMRAYINNIGIGDYLIKPTTLRVVKGFIVFIRKCV